MTGNSTENLWYIAREGQQHGPISDTEMRLFVDNGHLRQTDLLWRAGFSEWRPAATVFPSPSTAAPDLSPRAPETSTEKVASEPEKSSSAPTQAAETAPQRVEEKPVGPATSARSVEANSSWPSATARPAQASPAQSQASPARSSQAASPYAASPSAVSPSAASPSYGATSPAAGRAPGQAPAGPGPAGSGPVSSNSPGKSPVAGNAGQAAARGPGPRNGGPNNQPAAQQPAAQRTAPTRPATQQSGGSPAMASAYPPTDARAEPSAKAGSGGRKKLVLAAALLTIIAGSLFYVVSNKDSIIALMSGGDAGGGVPVVKADTAPQVKSEQETAALQGTALQGSAQSNESMPAPSDQGQTAPLTSDATAPASRSATLNSNISPAATQPVENSPSVADTYYQQSKLWQYMKRAYPDWYGERINEVAALGNGSAPPRDATKSLVEGLVALRRQHANEALQANTGMLKAIAAAFLTNLQSLAEKGPDTCYGFISQGETSPKSLDLFHNPQSSPELEGQALAIFEAIAAGKATPTQHDRPKKGDYDVLAAELGKLGWSQADLQLFADPKALSSAPPARVCSMVRDWFKAHIAISDTSVQERLLFETLRPVVAG